MLRFEPIKSCPRSCFWMKLSENPAITEEIITTNINLSWNWHYISKNISISLEFIDQHKDELDNYVGLSQNPNLTLNYIENNLDKEWSWINIWFNPLTKDKEDNEEYMIQEYRKHLAAVLIQNAWKNARVNHNCPLGKRTIKRDMDFAGLPEEEVEE